MGEQARTALPAIVPAMLLAAAFLLAAWQPWRRRPPVQRGYWGAPLAFGFGFLIAFIVLTQWRGVQLKDRWHWLWPITMVATALGLTAALWRPRWPLRFIIACVLAIAVGFLLHPPASIPQPMIWKIVFGLTVLVMWLQLEFVAEFAKGGGTSLSLALSIVFSGLSMVLLQTQQAGFSLLAAAVGAMCGVAFVIALLNRNMTLAHGGTHIIATLLPGFVITGWLYNRSSVGIWPFALILIAPLALCCSEFALSRRLKSWQLAMIRIVSVTVPVAIAVALAVRATDAAG